MPSRRQRPLQFVALTTPCRLVDTRPQYGGSGPVQGGVPQSFVLTGRAGCNIPASAQAFSLNVTVVPPGPLGFLIIWPTGEPQPGVSTLNSVDGRTKANAAIIGAGTNGAVSVYVSQTTNVLLDINGYFVSATDSALAFYPLTPCRLADTRPQYGGGGPIRGGTTQSFPILDIAGCTVPSTAVAYSLNITAVPINALYYLTIWPKGDPLPNVSTLNDVPGTIVANAAIVVGGLGGEISAYPSNDTNLVIDIDGYFAPPAPGGLALYTVMPCRVIDTRRIGTGQPFSGTLVPPVDVAHSACAPPPQPQPLAYVLNGTVVPQGALGYLTLWPDGESLPNVSTLNALDGIIASNMAIVPTDQGPDYGKINAYAAGTTQLVLDISAYFAPLPTLSITTTSLPGGTINVPYSSTLAATGGEPPYSWTVTGGSLPPGLGLSSNGTISGTPIAGGMYSFTVQVTDTLANTASAMLSITIQTGSLVITTTQLPAGTVNVPYSASLGASGGTPPYMWSIISGTLPIGLSLNSGGMISGTPTVAGSSNFTVQVQDSSSPPVLATAPLSITINAGTTNAALQGNYALSFNGFNNGSPVFMAGSFIADGNGNITSGVLDIRDATGNTEQPVTLTGTYSIQANGLGAMTLTPSQGPALVFAVAISNRGLSGTSRNGNLILRDPSNPGSYGSGIILVQNSLNFKLSSLVGNYALGYFGVDASLKRIAGAAAYQMGQTGNLTNGAEDINDNGVYHAPRRSPVLLARWMS